MPALSQAGGVDVPHGLVFFRTSKELVKVQFEIEDATGKKIVQKREVELMAHASRRLSNLQADDPEAEMQADDANVCEDFFLMDGSDPIGIPDTWAEARQAFRNLCEDYMFDRSECQQHELSTFDGYPSDSQVLNIDDALCNRLLRFSYQWLYGTEWTGPGLPPHILVRRLKGAAASAGGRSYGYAGTTMTRGYPMGYASTGYGYSGRAAVFGTYMVIMPVGLYGGRHYGNNGCNSNSESCNYQMESSQTMMRDDIETAIVNPEEQEGVSPYTVVIHQVTGTDFDVSKLCGGTGGQDLFVMLAPLGEVESNTLLGSIFTGVAFFLFGLCACRFFRNRGKKRTLEEGPEQLSAAHIYDTEATDTWKAIGALGPLLKDVEAVGVKIRWKDQGPSWDSKGQVRAILRRHDGDRTMDIFHSKSGHEMTFEHTTISSFMGTTFNEDDMVQFEYVVGDPAGHELHIESFEAWAIYASTLRPSQQGYGAPLPNCASDLRKNGSCQEEVNPVMTGIPNRAAPVQVGVPINPVRVPSKEGAHHSNLPGMMQ